MHICKYTLLTLILGVTLHFVGFAQEVPQRYSVKASFLAEHSVDQESSRRGTAQGEEDSCLRRNDVLTERHWEVPATFDSTAYHFAETITPSDLKHHLSILASDAYEGRETGKKGQKMAADYISGIFKQEGLTGPVGDTSYFQHFPVVETSWANPYIEIKGKKYAFLKDFYTLTSLAEDMELDFEKVVFAGYGIESEGYDDYEGLDVEGKVVLVLDGEPMAQDSTYLVSGTAEPSRFSTNFFAGLRTKRAIAARHGAKALLIIDDHFDTNLRRYMLYLRQPSMEMKTEKQQESEEPATDVALVSKELGQALLGRKDLTAVAERISKKEKPRTFKLRKKGTLAFEQDIEHLTSSNVLGYMEGTDLKDEVIVISAHYDHIGITNGEINNGADDDGSGTVSVLEIAQAFAEAKAAGEGPRRSILFLAVSGEEKGLFGSEYYTDHPVFPLENTVTDLNIDMIGRIDAEHQEDSNYVYVIGSDMLSTELHEINEKANQMYTNLELDYTYNDPSDPNRFYYRSDHYNFAKHNIPIIFYFNGVHPDYHKPTDTVEKISFDIMTKRAKLVFYTAWQLANQEKRIEVDVSGGK